MEEQEKSDELESCYLENGIIDYSQLKKIWFGSDLKTLQELQKYFDIQDENFKQKTKGWAFTKRALKFLYEKKIDDFEEAKSRLELLWCDLLYRLGTCRNVSETSLAEIKHIAAMASALKIIHSGMGQLSILEQQDDLPAFFVEGVDIEKL